MLQTCPSPLTLAEEQNRFGPKCPEQNVDPYHHRGEEGEKSDQISHVGGQDDFFQILDDDQGRFGDEQESLGDHFTSLLKRFGDSGGDETGFAT